VTLRALFALCRSNGEQKNGGFHFVEAAIQFYFVCR